MSNAVVQIKRPDHAAEERQDPLRAERAALAAAIEAEAEAKRVLDRAEQALQRGRGVVAAAQDEAERARKLVEKAKESDSRRTAAAVRAKSSGATPDASATRAARLRAVECDADVEVSQGAIERLEQELAEAATASLCATNQVIVARNNLLAQFCEQLLECARSRRRDLKVAEAVLSQMLNDDAGPELPDDVTASIRLREERTARLGLIRKQASSFFLSRTTEDEDAAMAAAVSEIRAFVARLDPSAEFPSLP